jgi:hypothetical protein
LSRTRSLCQGLYEPGDRGLKVISVVAAVLRLWFPDRACSNRCMACSRDEQTLHPICAAATGAVGWATSPVIARAKAVSTAVVPGQEGAKDSLEADWVAGSRNVHCQTDALAVSSWWVAQYGGKTRQDKGGAAWAEQPCFGLQVLAIHLWVAG